jgi:hypothetical protein
MSLAPLISLLSIWWRWGTPDNALLKFLFFGNTAVTEYYSSFFIVIHVMGSKWHVWFSTSFTEHITCNFLIINYLYFLLKITIWKGCEEAPWKNKWNGWCLCKSMHRTSQRNGCALRWYLVKDASDWRVAETLLKVNAFSDLFTLLGWRFCLHFSGFKYFHAFGCKTIL